MSFSQLVFELGPPPPEKLKSKKKKKKGFEILGPPLLRIPGQVILCACVEVGLGGGGGGGGVGSVCLIIQIPV